MPQVSDEERILRVWTPVILRTVLTVATVILVIGLVAMAHQAPGAFVARYRHVQATGAPSETEAWSAIPASALRGDPHAVLTLGLVALTLVPLARVGFCFLLFLKERDELYVIFTAYVLLGLFAGVVLGRIG